MVDKSQENDALWFSDRREGTKSGYGRPRFPFRGIKIRCHE